MQSVTLKEIANAVGGTLNVDSDVRIDCVCTDTRKITEGCLYIAIKGENFDGHRFIDKAFELGAKAAVSSEPIVTDKPVVYVNDTRQAFGALAGWYRSLFPVYVVGVTGSVGKTSTKEMIHTVMSRKWKTLKTQGNFNNDIGLPRTLLELDGSYQGAVIEMGMSALGEISYLTKLAKPDLGVITNIGVSHLEKLGTRDNILKAKLEILDGMREDAKLILNADNDKLRSVREQLGERALYFGIEQDGIVTASHVAQVGDETAFVIHYAGKSLDAVIPTIGLHNVYNALAAFLVGIEIGLTPEEIVASYRQYQNSGMRQNICERGGVKVIADCYNASPDSMQSSINVISTVSCSGQRVAVFGDMLELGEQAAQLHQSVGRMAANSNIDLLYCYGNDAAHIREGALAAGLTNVYHYTDKDALAAELKGVLKPGDAIIFKASRGIKLEEVIEKVFA